MTTRLTIEDLAAPLPLPRPAQTEREPVRVREPAPPSEPISAAAYGATVTRMAFAALAAVHESGKPGVLRPEAADVHACFAYHVRALSQELLRAMQWVNEAMRCADDLDARLQRALLAVQAREDADENAYDDEDDDDDYYEAEVDAASASESESSLSATNVSATKLELERVQDLLDVYTASSAAVEAELEQELRQSNDVNARLQQQLQALESENEALLEKLARFVDETASCAAEQDALYGHDATSSSCYEEAEDEPEEVVMNQATKTADAESENKNGCVNLNAPAATPAEAQHGSTQVQAQARVFVSGIVRPKIVVPAAILRRAREERVRRASTASQLQHESLSTAAAESSAQAPEAAIALAMRMAPSPQEAPTPQPSKQKKMQPTPTLPPSKPEPRKDIPSRRHLAGASRRPIAETPAPAELLWLAAKEATLTNPSTTAPAIPQPASEAATRSAHSCPVVLRWTQLLLSSTDEPKLLTY